MTEKIHLFLLILCGILCKGIIATLSDDDIKESSDLLLREKRVVDLDQQGHGSTSIEAVRYMTVIKENQRSACIGVILSSRTVITAAMCIMLNLNVYEVLSDTAFPHLGKCHNVTSKVTNYGNSPKLHYDGIALLNIDPPFTFGPKTGSIFLYAGPLRIGTECTVSGWGCGYPILPPARLQKRLRQVKLPIMDRRQCEHIYRDNFKISYKHICTYHERKYCARTDQGAPLVIDNKLAGILVFKPEVRNQPNPDVFVDLQLPEYSVWIRQNIRFG